MNPWQILGIDRDADPTSVKRSYSRLLKINRPEDNPEGFQQLRWAYEFALQHAQSLESGHPEAADTANPDSPRVEDPGTRYASDAHAELVADVVAEASTHSTTDSAAHLQRDDATISGLLLDRCRPGTFDAEQFALWQYECPELTGFDAKDRIELRVLERLAGGDPIDLDAWRNLAEYFSWHEVWSVGRLTERHPQAAQWLFDAERFVRRLELDQWISAGSCLGQTGPERVSERNAVRLLRAEPRRMAIFFNNFLDENQIRAVAATWRLYRDAFGIDAVQAVFNPNSARMWAELAAPNAHGKEYFMLSLARTLFFACSALIVFSAFNSARSLGDNEDLKGKLAVATAGFAAAAIIAISVYVFRWLAGSVAPRHERFRLAARSFVWRLASSWRGALAATVVSLVVAMQPERTHFWIGLSSFLLAVWLGTGIAGLVSAAGWIYLAFGLLPPELSWPLKIVLPGAVGTAISMLPLARWADQHNRVLVPTTTTRIPRPLFAIIVSGLVAFFAALIAMSR